jgi:hypothetical protein
MIVVLIAYPMDRLVRERLFAMKMFWVLKTRVIVRVAETMARMIQRQS